MTGRKKFFLTAGCTLGAALLYLIGCFLHLWLIVVPHSYAAWASGDLLVVYMEKHHGKWPHNWDDLREAEKSILTEHSRPVYYPIDKVEKIVKIDWSFDPAAWRGGPVHVVTQLDGSRLEANWGRDTEPNQKVHDYLEKKKGAGKP